MRIQGPAVIVAEPTPFPARLTACLAIGVVSSMLATADVEAAVVAINLANVGGQDITGSNAGLAAYNDPGRAISDWLGAGTGGTLNISRSTGRGIGLDGSAGLEFAVTTGTYAMPRNFGFSDPIGPSVNFSDDGALTHFAWCDESDDDTWYLSPDFGANSFLGFRFGSGSTWNYGYIEAVWVWTGDAGNSSFQLLSAAYESTANTAILAGATPVPVPAPSALALLALGGRMQRARRRTA